MTRTTRRLLWVLLLACCLTAAIPAVFNKAHTAHAAKLNKTAMDLFKGSSGQLILKKADGDIVWKSTKPQVASVDENGLVTGKKSGKCTIVAKLGGNKYKCKVTVRSLSGVNTLGAMKGIDVSAWQGTINFTKVKNDGIGFVIMRVGHGMQVDSTFRRNYRKAKKAGLLVGCYWFITATSDSALKAQANKCLKTIRGKSFDLPVFVDIESYSQFNKGKAFCSNLVSTFCEMVKEAGYQPGWYTSRSFVGPYLTDKVAVGSGYTAWVAEHGRILHYDNIADIWQYSHTGRVNGIKTYVDLNWYFPNARTEDH